MVEQITQLKLSTIVKNPYQPRLVFDEDKLKAVIDATGYKVTSITKAPYVKKGFFASFRK